jgi:hypothetical protein
LDLGELTLTLHPALLEKNDWGREDDLYGLFRLTLEGITRAGVAGLGARGRRPLQRKELHVLRGEHLELAPGDVLLLDSVLLFQGQISDVEVAGLSWLQCSFLVFEHNLARYFEVILTWSVHQTPKFELKVLTERDLEDLDKAE